MFDLVIASAIHAAMVQTAAADNARTALRTCIKQAAAQAKTQKLPADGFTAFVRQQCASAEATLKSAIWAFDSKNKVSKRQSESDANMQIEDFVTMAAERYQMETTPQ